MSIEELYGGRGEKGNAEPSLDIVAVHGLNPFNKSDHAIATWQEPASKSLWLRDSLPHSQPNARILLYAYESSPAFGADKERFVHQANSLLECLRLKRRKEPGRPLIMIGHSLGGILIKQALVNAQNNPVYKSVKKATFGLIFFGTPHCGPATSMKVRFGKAIVAIAQSMPWKVSNDVMEALKKGSLFSDVLGEHWRHQLEQYQFLSFYEGIGSIVPRESAVIGLVGDRESQVRLNANHSDMCRFNLNVKVDKDNYFFVEENIAIMCEKRPVRTIDYENLRRRLGEIGSNPRHERISEKHENSFQWIWESGVDGTGFLDWLVSDLPIYWITGLPGSGKSTLMKYIYAASRAYIPSGHSKPIVMGYFFHELGESQEQSFKSFLASFLRQILTAFDILNSQVLQILRQTEENHSEIETPLVLEEHTLKQALMIVAEHSMSAGKVVLFLDGLDECSGDNRSQVDFLTRLVDTSKKSKLSIRMCLASRSLPEIEPRLECYPRCKIHEWTANDISEYVTDKLTNPWRLMGNYHSDQNFHEHDIRQSIVDKAGGVFLWVELVVNNLIIGLEEGDTREELVERLESLPSDLEKLYGRIIQQIPAKYIHDTINYINLLKLPFILHNDSHNADDSDSDNDSIQKTIPAKHYRSDTDDRSTRQKSITLLDFALATRDPNESLNQSMEHTDDAHKKVQTYCELVERRIKSRCRGLIYVREPMSKGSAEPETRILRTGTRHLSGPLTPSITSTVEFLHLTVEKYITSEGFMASVMGKSKSDCVRPVSVGLQAALLSMMKMLPPDQLFEKIKASEESLSQLFSYVRHNFTPRRDGTLFHAVAYGALLEYFKRCRRAEIETGTSQRPFIKELDRVCNLGCKDWCTKFYEYLLSRPAKSKYSELQPVRSPLVIDLFCVCIFMGLDIYVGEEVESFRHSIREPQRSLLLRAVFDTRHRLPRAPEVLKSLLKLGARPNQEYEGETNWQYALKVVLVYRFGLRDYLMLNTMLDFGANPNERLSQNRESPLLKAIKTINLKEQWGYPQFNNLRSMDDLPSQHQVRLIESFINHGIDFKRNLADILTGVKLHHPKLEVAVAQKIKELQTSQQKKSSIGQKRKTADIAIRPAKRQEMDNEEF